MRYVAGKLELCVCAVLLSVNTAASFGAGVKLESFPDSSPPGQEHFNYGLLVLPPWEDGGKLVINFPEHLEYDGGMGILRYSDAVPGNRAGRGILLGVARRLRPDSRSERYEYAGGCRPSRRQRQSKGTAFRHT